MFEDNNNKYVSIGTGAVCLLEQSSNSDPVRAVCLLEQSSNSDPARAVIEQNFVKPNIYPIISFGIINFTLTGKFEKYNNIFKNKYIIKEPSIQCINFEKVNKINLYWFNNKNIDKCNDLLCNELIETLRNSILFLMISRKNSLGYIEFIRGNYDCNNIESIKYLFEQMTEIEILNIITENFDTLWCNLWKKSARNKNYEKEYEISLEKYNKIKDTNINIIKTFRPKYPTPEWGFPKGRRNVAEKDIDCAIRECKEETSLDNSEMKILDRVYPISEQFKGTNNIEYKHVYYLSIVETIRNLNTIIIPDQYIEVDNVGWFKYDRIINLIRPYHTDKKKLVDDIIKFIAYNILWLEKQKVISSSL